MKVHEAVTAVMEAVGAVRKDGRNNQQNFNFRGVDAVVNAVSPAMRKAGLTCHPSRVEHRPSGKQLSGGKIATSVDVVVDYTFTGPEGDTFTSQVVAEAFDLGDKATAKAMSVALRTCLLQTFMLPTDDTDPDTETYEQERHQRPNTGHPDDDRGTPGPKPAPQHDWKALYEATAGDKGKLEALRHTAKNAGAPENFWLFNWIEKALNPAPIEGNVQ
jgi:hypothetical protein